MAHISIRKLAVASSLVFVALLLFTSATLAVTVTIAHTWDTNSHTHKGLEAAARAFMAKNPNITVEIMQGVTEEKFITQVLGGAPADLQFVDGPFVSSYALQGLIEPLNKYIKASGINEKDFVPPAWRQNVWEGEVWAMPALVDPNFGLIWNKDLLNQAGLNADNGPATLAEYESFGKKLTRYNTDSQPQQIGMVPWDVYGEPNTMYTWGWIFGGKFYDAATKQVTAHDSNNVKALEWLRSYYQRYSGDLTTLDSGLPSGRNRFSAGREAMRFSVTGEISDYMRNFNDLSIGVGKMPYLPESGNTDPAWVGGWCVSITKGAKNPDAAWQFLKFLTADPEGTAAFAQASGWFPGYLRSPAFREKFAKDPLLSIYMNILLGATNQRPVMPVQKTYWSELTRALQDVFAGRNQPQAALETVSKRVADELAKALVKK